MQYIVCVMKWLHTPNAGGNMFFNLLCPKTAKRRKSKKNKKFDAKCSKKKLDQRYGAN